MPMKFSKTLMLAVIASSTILIAQEQPSKRPEGKPDKGNMEQPQGDQRGAMMERLKLSDDQRTQMEKLHTEFEKQQIAQRAKLQTSQLELRQLMRADNPDKAAIEKKINEVSQLGAQSRIARFNQMLSAKKILTPEQQKLMRERMEMGMRMRGQRGFAGPWQGGRGMMGAPHGRRFQMEGQMRRFGPGPQFEGRMRRPGPPGPEDRREQ